MKIFRMNIRLYEILSYSDEYVFLVRCVPTNYTETKALDYAPSI